MSRYLGQPIRLFWPYDIEAWYVYGHVSREGVIAAWGDELPADYTEPEHVYARLVPVAQPTLAGPDSWLRECARGRGAFAVTVVRWVRS